MPGRTPKTVIADRGYPDIRFPEGMGVRKLSNPMVSVNAIYGFRSLKSRFIVNRYKFMPSTSTNPRKPECTTVLLLQETGRGGEGWDGTKAKKILKKAGCYYSHARSRTGVSACHLLERAI